MTEVAYEKTRQIRSSPGYKVGSQASVQVTQIGSSRAQSCRENFKRGVSTKKIEFTLGSIVYMSKHPDMNGSKVLQYHYSTTETLYTTYIPETSDVLKLTTPRMSSRKEQGISGGFRGVSALKSEVTESVDFDASSDEIRRW